MGYSLGAIDWSETFVGQFFGGNLRAVFSIITIIFVCCVSMTVTSFSEIPLPLLEELHQEKDELNHPPKPGGTEKRHSEETPMTKGIGAEAAGYGALDNTDSTTTLATSHKSRVSGWQCRYLILSIVVQLS